MSPPLLPVATIRAIEHNALAQLAPYTLMYRAGRATATLSMQLVAGTDTPILVLAGPGNNGNDAFETACHLATHGHAVTIACLDPHTPIHHDPAHPYSRAKAGKARWIDITTLASYADTPWGLIVDGLFGIGLNRPLSGDLARVINTVNTQPCPVVAIDVPSGIDADTGSIVGQSEGVAIMATHTITFIADKPGLHTCDGAAHAGHVIVDLLGLDQKDMPGDTTTLLTKAMLAGTFKPRHGNAHKGSFGDVLVIGGAQGMAGAPILSARAALMSGAGRIFVAFAGPAPAYDPLHPELMCRDADTVDVGNAVVVIGPGLGQSAQARTLVERALSAPNPLVIDADALNLIATHIPLQAMMRARKPHTTIITPHPLEAARLLGTNTQAIQRDRIQAATQLASTFNCIALLKGAGTVIATTPASTFINTTGNPALATGGTGDVLAGLCGALVAQHIPMDMAALAAAWVHGKAADNLVDQGVGPNGLTASELIAGIRQVINTFVTGKPCASDGQYTS